jgi:hypothetical protein
VKFLEVVTRTYKRPTLLAENQASVTALGDDVRHTILRDEVGIGCAAANAQLALFAPLAKYVWVLDDDDMCTHPGLVADLKYLDWLHGAPAAVIVRMDHGADMGVLPKDHDWQQAPKEAGIGCSGIITRRDVWMRHRHAWATGRYAADYDFINSVYSTWPNSIVWHDVIASRCQRISHGLPEGA